MIIIPFTLKTYWLDQKKQENYKMSSIYILYAYFFICLLIGMVQSANILVFMPLPAFSHTNAYMPIFTELARRGHNVTMVSPYPQKTPIPNFTDVVLENTLEKVLKRIAATNDLRDNKFLFNLLGIWPMCEEFLNPITETKELQEFLMDKDSKFDLVILEVFFCQQPFLGLGHKYGAPIVTMTGPFLTASTALMSGNPNPVAYVPSIMRPFTDHMTFIERIQNTFDSILEIFISEFYGYKIMDKYMREHLGKYPGFANLPTVSEMQRNISLFMIDNHFSLYYPRPFLPNVVEFGGLSVKTGGKLPADIDKFMNESKDGVIFFTWGSHYKMTKMKPELLASFLSIFRKLKQRVIMKWENETLPGKSDNIKIGHWFPQSEILSHPNIRLFISHCGIHGITEAIYNAVPVLGTPLFADQDFNLNVLERAGMAEKVNIDTVTEEELYTAFKKLLNDPKYKENAKKKSEMMKDRPLNALDNAVYWIEYVIRHDGARHLRPGSLDLAWYQNLLLDIVGAILAVVIVIILISFYLIKFLINICIRKLSKYKDNQENEQKNKKYKIKKGKKD